MAQSFTRTDTAVIQRARRKRREVIVLRDDRDWLATYSSSPKDMLHRMANRGALIRLGAGRYAIPVLGEDSPAYKSWQPMVHSRLAPLGRYYLTGLTALAEHGLTDIGPPEVTAVIGFRNSLLESGTVEVAGRRIRVARSLREDPFSESAGIELVRLSRSENYYRSDPTRTLVDSLWHPTLFGATETWMSAWGRGDRRRLDVEAACRYALALGASVARRTGAVLDLLGHGSVAERLIPPRLRRSDRVTLFVGNGPSRTASTEIHPVWHVAFNVDRHRLMGWLSYGK
jgi:predicted transcriptional regulator of viral defense system